MDYGRLGFSRGCKLERCRECSMSWIRVVEDERRAGPPATARSTLETTVT